MNLVIDASYMAQGGKPCASLLASLADHSNHVTIFGSTEIGLSVDWPQYVVSEPSTFADVVQNLALANRGDVVLAVTNRQDEAHKISGHSGIIPILMSNTDTMQSPLCSSGSYLVLDKPDDVMMLLNDQNARPLLSLFRIDACGLAQEQTSRLDHLKHRISLAQGVCIYGAGTIGRQALTAARRAQLPIKAFVDANPQLQGQLISGVPVIAPAELLNGIDIVVPSLGRHLSQVRRTLLSCDAGLMSLSELYYLSQTPSEPEMNYWTDLEQHRIRYLALFLSLADQRSREVLAALVQHRLTLDPLALEAMCECDHPQWFDPQFLPLKPSSVFVDGGAFDGDTVEGFIKAHGPDYRAIYAFELDPQIAARGSLRLHDYPNVHYCNVGLSNRSGHVSIRSTGGTDGGISGHAPTSLLQHGNSRNLVPAETCVAIGRLDDLVSEPISFLKLDVEGEEANVLDGVKQHIQTDQPTIGLAVYHHAHDIWSLPEQLLSMRSDYRLYLRHYTDLAYETVIYAIPEA